MSRSGFLLLVAWLTALPATSAELPPERTRASSIEASVEDPAHGIEARFTERSLRVAPVSSEAWTLELTRSGEAAGIESWIGSSHDGLVQGIELQEPPAPGEKRPLSVTFELRGNLVPKLEESGRQLTLYLEGVPVLRYALLRATDANAVEQPAHMELGARGDLTLVLERAGAAPVTLELSIAAAKGARHAAGSPQPSGPEAAPANDTCEGATVIPAGGPFPFTTAAVDITDATSTGDPVPRPTCAFPTDPVTRSVWYQFTPSQTGIYSFSTCEGAATCLGDSGTTVDDPVMAIYTSVGGCPGIFTQLLGACDDDGCDQRPFQSYVETTLLAAVTYYIVIWNEGPAPVAGHTSLRVRVDRPGAPPPNDTCAGGSAPPYTIPSVVPLNGYLTPVSPDITDATSTGDPVLPSCLTPGFAATRGTWYNFTPATSGVYRISSCASDAPGSTVDDTLIALYTSLTGCLGPFVELPTGGASDGCDDDSCGVLNLQGVIDTQLDAGTTYYIVVYKVGAAPPGCASAVQLFVTELRPPPNDQCAGALPIGLDAPQSGTTENAVDDYRASFTAACFSGVGQTLSSSVGADVVYRFSAPSSDKYSFRVTGFSTTRNLILYVANDCPLGPSPTTPDCLAAANRSSSTPAEEVACLQLAAGKTVWIYVDDTGSTGGSPYTLEVNRCHPGTEPASTPVTCGIEGSISPAGDVDFYDLGTPASLSRIFSLVDGVAGNSSDFDLRVTTDAATLEYDDFDADVPFGPLSGTCDGTPLTGVVSYLRVSTFNSQASAEPYRLYSVLEPALSSATPESEPNDTGAQANQSALGYFSGTLSGTSPSTDVDWYRFDAAAGTLILVGLDGDPLRDRTPLNASLSLHAAPGAPPLVAVDDANGSSVTTAGTSTTATTPHSPGEALTWRARSTGTYYVKVAAGQQASTPRAGDYLLAISTGCLPRSDDPDGDGAATATDCAPTDPGAFSIPGEATALMLGPLKGTLSWVAAEGGSANLHDVLRGSLAALPVGPGGADETCFDNLSSTFLVEPTNPLTGEGFWYLVRGVNGCGTGSYGNEGRLGSAGPARVSTTCP